MARKLRAVLPDLGLNGEKAVVTDVRNRVIIVYGWISRLFLDQTGGVISSSGRYAEMTAM